MKKRNLFQYFSDCVTRDYFNFSGRARRMEFWSYWLIYILITIGTSVLADTFGTQDLIGGNEQLWVIFIPILLGFIPLLAAATRRMHDLGKSGTMLLVYLIPFIGGLWLLILLLSDGQDGTNRYGQNPKAPAIPDEINLIGVE
jgi:uncharacterized membrane protein YhaH (DUF805 family)